MKRVSSDHIHRSPFQHWIVRETLTINTVCKNYWIAAKKSLNESSCIYITVMQLMLQQTIIYQCRCRYLCKQVLKFHDLVAIFVLSQQFLNKHGNLLHGEF